MPIAVDNKRGISYLKFGHGDIIIGSYSGKQEGTGVVFASTEHKREIGHGAFENGKKIHELDIKVLMQFDEIESIDVLIGVLQNHKSRLLNKKLY